MLWCSMSVQFIRLLKPNDWKSTGLFIDLHPSYHLFTAAASGCLLVSFFRHCRIDNSYLPTSISAPWCNRAKAKASD